MLNGPILTLFEFGTAKKFFGLLHNSSLLVSNSIAVLRDNAAPPRINRSGLIPLQPAKFRVIDYY
jgi:hypothetical protein